MRRLPSLLLPALLLAAPLAAGGCSVFEAPVQQRGNKVDPDRLKELTVGTSTRQDVASLLGSPTARGTFDDNTWIYISEATQNRIGRLPAVRDQNVVVLTFDQGGVLRGMHRLGPEDARDVTMVARATPSPGSEASFMQQLLGNIGRFSPGGPSNAGSSGGGINRSSGF